MGDQYADMPLGLNGMRDEYKEDADFDVLEEDYNETTDDEESEGEDKKVTVILYHKIRQPDRKLTWATIQNGDHIRVGHSGKLIKAHIECVEPFLLSNLQIRLVYEDVDPYLKERIHQAVELTSIRPSKFSSPINESVSTPVRECIVHLKISVAQLSVVQFHISIALSSGTIVSTLSPRFFPHDNGKKKKHYAPLMTQEETASSFLLQGSLDVSGHVRAQSFRQYSDYHLKHDIRDLDAALDVLLRLQGKSYRWNHSPNNDPRRSFGVVAQELQQVLPDLVAQDSKGLLSVSYTDLIPFLIEGIKTHVTQTRDAITRLEERVVAAEKGKGEVCVCGGRGEMRGVVVREESGSDGGVRSLGLSSGSGGCQMTCSASHSTLRDARLGRSMANPFRVVVGFVIFLILLFYLF